MPASGRDPDSRLAGIHALASARNAILGWWEQAWADNLALAVQFQMEAMVALPVQDDPDRGEVFAGLEGRRLRLRLDRQVEE